MTTQDVLVALGELHKRAELAIEAVTELRAALEAPHSNHERLRRLRESGVLMQLDLWFARAKLLVRAGLIESHLHEDRGLYAACLALEAMGPFPDRAEADHAPASVIMRKLGSGPPLTPDEMRALQAGDVPPRVREMIERELLAGPEDAEDDHG